MPRVLVLHSDGGASAAVAALRRSAGELHARGCELVVRDVGTGLRAVRRVRAAIAETNPDVVHALGPVAVRTAVLVLTATVRRRPRVVASGCERVIDRLTRFALRWVDQVVTLPRVVEEADRASRERERPELYAPPVAHAPGSPGNAPKFPFPYLLAAGGFDDAVDAKAVVWAFDVLKYAAPGLHLVFLGSGINRRDVEEFAAALASDDLRTHFPGYQSDVGPYLAHASAAWITHRTGGAGFALDALAAEVPVLGYRTPDLQAVVADGVNGLLVPPGDPVALAAATRGLLADDARRERLVASGRATAAGHTAMAFADRLAAVYHEAARPTR